MTYKVLVDQNSAYQDETERYKLGEFQSLDEAIEAAKKIVDDFLQSAHNPDISAEELYKSYVSFGEDPFIVSPGSNEKQGAGVLFSAWEYAKSRCDTMCA